MSHCRLLFVGGRDNLQKIFDNVPDSSSETAAEMTIGADWISDYDWLNEEEKKGNRTTDNFTKISNPKLYQEVIDGMWHYCFDIRDPYHYGSFDCLNCLDFESYNGTCSREQEERNKMRTIEVLKTLPDDTLFHFADSHW